MKIRTGFVSNSSSSSFILFFDREIKIINDLKESLGDINTIHERWTGEIEEYSEKKILESILENIDNTDESLIEILSNDNVEIKGFDEDLPEYAYEKQDWAEQEKKFLEYGRRKMEFMKKKHQDKFIYTASYSDQDGTFGTFMEHYFNWGNIKVIRISQH